jgi:hypothetical protein
VSRRTLQFLVIPYGFINAPSTFQSLMNFVFKSFLQKIVLVFFYDILIYRKSREKHIQHVGMILPLLDEQKLYTKNYKYVFGVKK